jgi:tungstate transport system permease protein
MIDANHPTLRTGRMQSDVAPILWLSLVVAGAAVLIASLIGVPLGLWLGRLNFRGKRIVWALVYAGMGLPPVVVGLLIYLLLSRTGPLGFFGWLYTPRAMILAQVILCLPFVTGITMTTMAAIPDELHFQLRTLGASEWQAKWALLRQARSGVVLAIATAFGRSISEVGAVWMVGGNIEDHTRVLTTAIVLETGKGQFAIALFLGSVLLGIALIVNAIMLRYQGQPLP